MNALNELPELGGVCPHDVRVTAQQVVAALGVIIDGKKLDAEALMSAALARIVCELRTATRLVNREDYQLVEVFDGIADRIELIAESAPYLAQLNLAAEGAS